MPDLAARVSCLSVCKSRAIPCQTLSHARSTSQGEALCLLHKSLEQLTAFSYSVPVLPGTLKQLLAEVKAGNACVGFGTSACWAPRQGTTALDACCALLGSPCFLSREQAAQVWLHLALCHLWVTTGAGNSQLRPKTAQIWK